MRDYGDPDVLRRLIIDVRTMVEADLFVGTASSCLGRFVYEQRTAKDPFSFDSVLIDMEYLFEDMTLVEYTAEQEENNGRFLGMKPGDDIALRIFSVSATMRGPF